MRRAYCGISAMPAREAAGAPPEDLTCNPARFVRLRRGAGGAGRDDSRPQPGWKDDLEGHSLKAAARRALLLAAAAMLAQPETAAAGDFRLLRIDGVSVKWDSPDLGRGASVTWAFAAKAETLADAANCRSILPIDRLSAAWKHDPGRLAAVARAAFGMWSRAADLQFREAAPGEAPDILIGAQAKPEGIAFANVWHGPGDKGVAPLTRASVCFNPEVAWTTDAGPAPAGVYDLATVLAHEVGHAIGLDHPGPRGALMAYSNQGALDALMPGDVAGAVLLYGPAPTTP